MRNLRNVALAILAVVLLLGLGACGGGDQQPASSSGGRQAAPAEKPAAKTAEPIKVGAVFAITGPASWLGKPEANVTQMLTEEINAKGGVNGRPLEVIVKDSQGNGERAVNAVKELLREGVVAIIGPSRSGTSMAVAPIAEEQEIPLISCAALEQIVTGRKWVFKTPHKDTHVVERIYDYMKEKGMKRVALITGTTGFGAGGRQKLQEMAPKYGIEIVADETYEPSDTDMTAQLTKIKAKNPDALVNWSIVPAQSIMMKNMKQLGMTTQLFQSHGFGNYNYLKAAGEAAEGVIFPAGRALAPEGLDDSNPQKGLLVSLKQKYEARYEDSLSTFAGHAWDALMLVVEACEKSGATPAQIRDYIEQKQNFVGTGGVFSFSAEDHTGLQKDSLEMLTVKGGKFTVLED